NERFFARIDVEGEARAKHVHQCGGASIERRRLSLVDVATAESACCGDRRDVNRPRRHGATGGGAAAPPRAGGSVCERRALRASRRNGRDWRLPRWVARGMVVPRTGNREHRTSRRRKEESRDFQGSLLEAPES